MGRVVTTFQSPNGHTKIAQKLDNIGLEMLSYFCTCFCILFAINITWGSDKICYNN